MRLGKREVVGLIFLLFCAIVVTMLLYRPPTINTNGPLHESPASQRVFGIRAAAWICCYLGTVTTQLSREPSTVAGCRVADFVYLHTVPHVGTYAL